ncbi:MAG: hypothetical protein ACKO96_48985, partial [Flammeovirgaceae bacterium]
RTQRKFLSTGQLSPNIKPGQRKNSGLADEQDKKSNTNEDYSDVYEILACLDTNLADYIRTQKGSRNMQKLLNKILQYTFLKKNILCSEEQHCANF